jgi:SAM-dependent methyltransferase
MSMGPDSDTQFDHYATEYEQALAAGISVSGEDSAYFAKGRVAFVANCLKQLAEQPISVLDFGCGTGSAAPYLSELPRVEAVIGVDTSEQSLDVARRTRKVDQARFLSLQQYVPSGEIDLAFCNGVFHHIPPRERAGAIDYIHRALRPDGLFAFWENNPWNPGTRYVMSRIPFDRDAITLTPPEARTMLRANGFIDLRTDFLFIFPRVFSWLRGAERFVTKLPLGAQFLVLSRKR